MNDSPSIRDILDFWFLPLDDPEHGKPRKIWWGGPAEFDAEIRSRFGDLLERAIGGGLDHWQKSPDGALALILLCDQFPRNMHRRSARAFCGDAKARETARLAVARNYPAAFNLDMRLFFYRPFQHSESLEDQKIGCALFEAFHSEDMQKHATDHLNVVLRFGRFPHRNEVLGRDCTDDELEFLKTANRFGQ